ncbi:MAG TPA: hypothetical protein VGR84_18980 [Candidatus Acidoferrales bacterium]|nr:hypothetical protein [Candidatus Acidoferrales bacterium]
MLVAYETATQQLLQAPSSPNPLIGTTQLDLAINTARLQTAIEGKCIRDYSTLAITAGVQQYAFSSIAFSGTVPGIASVIEVEMATYGVTAGKARINAREWAWFNNFVLSVAVPAPPKYWSQFGQGDDGTLWINVPDANYTAYLTTVCYPDDLVDDTTPEALPYPWTDAVPFYAAWLLFMSLQKEADAKEMMQNFEILMARARGGSTPDVLSHIYVQAPDPTLPNKLGISPQQRGGPAQ